MFAALGSRAPRFETRRALLIINMQPDSIQAGDFVLCPDTEFLERIKAMIPSYRLLGDIIWVRTEFGSQGHIPGDHVLSGVAPDPSSRLGFENYFPSSRAKARAKQKEKKKKGAGGLNPRNDDLGDFENDDSTDTIDGYLSKPRKDQPPQFYRPGTAGAALREDFLPLVDESSDLAIVKHHYSAFDATPLLMSLRMRFVTHLYLCGFSSNVSIYATAADAVRHGFEVSVVEDCMGYRSETRHVEAMENMADFLGVSGVDSEEIRLEASAQNLPPDADENIFSGPGVEGIGGIPETSGHASQACDAETRMIVDGGNGSAGTGARPDRPHRRGPSPSATKNASEIHDSETRATSTFAPGDCIGDGDSDVIYDALPAHFGEKAFGLVRDEVGWHAMRHRSGEVPRKVAVQGAIAADGSMPVYRHPADESPPLLPFSETVGKIRDIVQVILKQPFNHALIQLYRDGQDNISEHSDKTLDIVRGSSIVNVSLGAQRNMTLRTKRAPNAKGEDGSAVPRQTQKIPLPNNSMFVLGSRTNARWLHGIRPDRRLLAEKSEAELAFGGERISITFRNIGTSMSADRSKIWGQGALSKYQATAGNVVSVNGGEMDAMIIAFGNENRQADFDWEREYGKGFDVLNLVSARSMLYLCGDEIANLRVKMCVLSSGLDCGITRTRPATPDKRPPGSRRTIFALSGDDAPLLREADPNCSEIAGDLAILLYLNKLYPSSLAGLTSAGPSSTAPIASVADSPGVESRATSSRELQRIASKVFARITQANELLFLWQELRGTPLTASTRATHQVRRMNSERPEKSLPVEQQQQQDGGPTVAALRLEAFEGELDVWEEYAEESDFIAGDYYAIVDCAFWPVLNEIVRRCEGWSERRYPNLADYWRKVGAMDSSRQALLDKGPGS